MRDFDDMKKIFLLLFLMSTSLYALEISIFTYNTYLLPDLGLALHTGQKARAIQISKMLPELLSKYDVVVLQEVFVKKYGEILRSHLTDFEYSISTPQRGKRKGFTLSSGVYLISRFKILSQEFIMYDKSLPFFYKDNKMADKGVLAVTFEKEGHPFCVLGTHMQSVVGDDSFEIQKAQLQDIYSLGKRCSQESKIPVFLAGDLNINFYDKEKYEQMLLLAQEDNVSVETMNLTNKSLRYSYDRNNNSLAWKSEPPQLLDYVLILNRGLFKKISVQQSVMAVEDKSGKPLSDHHAVEGIFNLSY